MYIENKTVTCQMFVSTERNKCHRENNGEIKTKKKVFSCVLYSESVNSVIPCEIVGTILL